MKARQQIGLEELFRLYPQLRLSHAEGAKQSQNDDRSAHSERVSASEHSHMDDAISGFSEA